MKIYLNNFTEKWSEEKITFNQTYVGSNRKTFVMKNIILLVLILFVFSSCDKHSEYHFKVRNDLPNNSIRINAWIENNFVSYNIHYNEAVELHEELGGLNRSAQDTYSYFGEIFDSIHVYKIDGSNLIKSDKNFLDRSEWTFFSNDDWVGIYTIAVDTTDF